MITKVTLLFLLINTTASQVNGGFWWMQNKTAKITGQFPSPPVIEELRAFDTDESDRVVFQDDDDPPFVTRHSQEETDKAHIKIHFQDKSKLSVTNTNSTEQTYYLIQTTNKSDTRESVEDILDFTFPGHKWNISRFDGGIVSVPTTSEANKSNVTDPNEVDANLVATEKPIDFDSNVTNVTMNVDSEPICTYIPESLCQKRGGTIYKKFHTFSKPCCIFPQKQRARSSRIYFPDEFEALKRAKRSDPAHLQRNAVLQRALSSGINNFGPRTPTNKATRIVSPSESEDDDPYWNIKTSHNRRPHQAEDQTKYDYGGQDYSDYTVELPKPGLVGIYSDNGRKPVWPRPSNPNSYGGGSFVSEEDDDDDEDFFGYTTVDPRKVLSNPKRPNQRPIKMMIHTNEDNDDQILQSHSTLDFNVLEGFKLLNLSRNKTKSFSKNTKITTVGVDSEEYSASSSPLDANLDSEYPDFMDINPDDKHCSKLQKLERLSSHSTANGSSPWLALAVRTKKPGNVLCYATVIHPRAAVTAAECVHGMSPGEVSVMAGMWDLTEDRGVSQQRLATIQEHPGYVSGTLANNIALLVWNVPLRFGSNVRAACVADPHVGDDCHFVGWGGYDIAMRPRPRRQSAAILTPRACKTRLSANKPGLNLPQDAFCATIDHQATVTGIGGPLTCQMDAKATVVGIATLRDNVIVLLPVTWAQKTIQELFS